MLIELVFQRVRLYSNIEMSFFSSSFQVQLNAVIKTDSRSRKQIRPVIYVRDGDWLACLDVNKPIGSNRSWIFVNISILEVWEKSSMALNITVTLRTLLVDETNVTDNINQVLLPKRSTLAVGLSSLIVGSLQFWEILLLFMPSWIPIS